MKALLLHRDQDFDPDQELPRQEQTLVQDLELDTLLRGMADGDEFLFAVARKVLFSGLTNDVDMILYRQEILNDSLRNPAVVRQLYDLAIEAIEKKKAKYYFGFFSRYPDGILRDAIEVLQMFMGTLRKLRDVTNAHAGGFASIGFTTLFVTLQKEFGEAFFASVHNHLTELQFNRGVLMSAELGKGNEGANYALRLDRDRKLSWLARILGKGPQAYIFRIADRDEAGSRALSELRDRGINLVANALAQSMEHILSFFVMLRTELAFYVGCLNLCDKLARLGVPISLPRPMSARTRLLRFSGLSDVCLALTMGRSVVRNSVAADGKSLVIITGANQGGKTSFLRSIGLAQLMMQSGMFVAAESFTGGLCTGLFTHFGREEDATMKSGKLDEELARMSDIIDGLAPDSLLLFNESFAATNEREGSEIARQVVRALLEKRIRVFFVTHLYEFAHAFIERATADAIFLRAERRTDGTRTFRLVQGEPLETSYGEDLYSKVFAGRTDEGRLITTAASKKGERHRSSYLQKE
jgi:hypothetical protein